jgi:hypothetical protein
MREPILPVEDSAASGSGLEYGDVINGEDFSGDEHSESTSISDDASRSVRLDIPVELAALDLKTPSEELYAAMVLLGDIVGSAEDELCFATALEIGFGLPMAIPLVERSPDKPSAAAGMG